MTDQSVKIAIIGTEGAGKTVFLTCLAKRYEGGGVNGCCLEPLGKETPFYVDRHWRGLCGGEWPPATNAREMFKLHWRLRVQSPSEPGEKVYTLRAVDAAGHDLRAFFADEAISAAETLPDDLRSLAEYCHAADVVLILINLRDFMADDELERVTANQWAIKYALDYKFAQRPDARCALVFTQVDSYGEALAGFPTWEAVAERFLPHVYAGYLRNTQSPLPILPVSAVNKTRLMISDNGLTRSTPEEGFSNDGFEELMDWLAGQAREQAETLQTSAVREQAETHAAQLAALEEKIVPLRRVHSGRVMRVAALTSVVLSVLAFFVLLSIFSADREMTRQENYTDTRYQDISVVLNAKGYIDWGNFSNDFQLTNKDTFDYTNTKIWVVVKGVTTFIDGGTIPAGGTRTFAGTPHGFETNDWSCSVQADQSIKHVAVEVPRTKSVTGRVTMRNWGAIILMEALAFISFFLVGARIFRASGRFPERKQLDALENERRDIENHLNQLSPMALKAGDPARAAQGESSLAPVQPGVGETES